LQAAFREATYRLAATRFFARDKRRKKSKDVLTSFSHFSVLAQAGSFKTHPTLRVLVFLSPLLIFAATVLLSILFTSIWFLIGGLAATLIYTIVLW